VTYRIVFAPEGREDLRGIYRYVAEQAGAERAFSYVERIIIFCHGFRTSPQRGMLRNDVYPGMRVVGFERRVSIAFHIDGNSVIFDRFLYAGRSFTSDEDPQSPG
jgi:toxin ParE1/3/4